MSLDESVIVALGSNLPGGWEDSTKVLQAALDRFASTGLHVVARSSLWRSTAWPDPAQPDYINAVALVETALPPTAVLARLHGLEASFGRERPHPNAARVLDLDLVAYGRQVIDAGELTLPHPRAAERLFVMGPLAELAPEWRHPVTGVTARVLAGAAPIGRDARPLTASSTVWYAT